MVSWSIAGKLLLLFVTFPFPRLRAFYNKIQNPPHPPRPLTPGTKYLLYFLFVSSAVSLISTLPFLQPTNIFTLTDSRLLHTSADTLYSRLSSIPNYPRALADDDLLWKRLTSRDGRLLYAFLGPCALSECLWCKIDFPMTFFYYIFPSIAGIHLLHLAVLGLVTSSANRHGSIWRTQATLAGVGMLAVEIWYVSTYDHRRNISARTAAETVYTYWRLLIYRGLAFAIVDGLLGYAIYHTGRWGGLIEESPAEKIEEIGRSLERGMNVLNSAVCLKQCVMKDRELRGKTARFWETEEAVNRGIMRDEKVRMAKRRVKSNGDWAKMEGDARKQARGITRELFVKSEKLEEVQPERQTEIDDEQESTDEGKGLAKYRTSKQTIFNRGRGRRRTVHRPFGWEMGDGRLECEGMQTSSRQRSMRGLFG